MSPSVKNTTFTFLISLEILWIMWNNLFPTFKRVTVFLFLGILSQRHFLMAIMYSFRLVSKIFNIFVHSEMKNTWPKRFVLDLFESPWEISSGGYQLIDQLWESQTAYYLWAGLGKVQKVMKHNVIHQLVTFLKPFLTFLKPAILKSCSQDNRKKV